ncbi:MAG: hypothetical protein R3240_02150 [Gammaproteobacteria bacterium]|nr:hypothetical protein [Gammaproteobacteria bacterium]
MAEQPKKTKELPQKWRASDKAMRAVQVAFYVDEQVQNKIRRDACIKGISPSDMIRSITQLPVSAPPKRPRLTASLNQEDYQLLADRYGLDPEDTLEIKRRVMQELIDYATHSEE